MTEVVFLAPAEQEMVEAAESYETQADGLGLAFLSEVRRAVCRIADNPEIGAVLRGDTRRVLVRRFPFGILYRIEPSEIVILAVMHLRRKPDYWKERS